MVDAAGTVHISYYDDKFGVRDLRYARKPAGGSFTTLAVHTAEPRGEEFPFFREFWLVTPQPEATTLTLYALLDSQRVTGAYQFVIHPGTDTRMDVTARVFFREDIEKLGIAPLTSMFFHGENSIRTVEDFRPESHDSDGLLLHFTSGEWLWRPIDNPRALNVSGFQMQAADGFGLVQRDSDFLNYQDLETRSSLFSSHHEHFRSLGHDASPCYRSSHGYRFSRTHIAPAIRD